MTELVQTNIIGPMLALYPPPQHLRGDAKKQAAALATYRKALSRFDGPTLAAAWERVTAAHEFWVWPNPGTVAAACRACAPPPPAVSDQERRQQEAVGMADAYAARFMRTTHLAKLAAAEGWASRLRGYVHDAAWVQAQLICGVEGIGFASTLVPPECRHLSAREFVVGYRDTVSGPVERGRIRVTVPPACIREWKSAGEPARRAPDGSPGRS